MNLTFSFKPVEEIAALAKEHETAPHLRLLQKALAAEMTTLVHSAEDLAAAQQASDILYGNAPVDALKTLPEQQLLEVMAGLPRAAGSHSSLSDGSFDLLTYLTEGGVFASKGEAKKMIQANSFSLNKAKVADTSRKIAEADLLHGKYLLLQKGKKYWLGVFE